MRKLIPLSLLLIAALALPAAAQSWEAGGLALASAYRDTDIIRGGATVGGIGFRPGPAGGLYFGQEIGDRLGGEIRYLFAHNDLRVRSGGADADFAGHTHTIGYDFLFYFKPRSATVRPFVAGGGGMKIYQGTGTERAFQPLGNLAILTRTNETMGTLDFGAGIKFQISPKTVFRVEVRDYVTEVPKLFAPGFGGATFQGWVHQWAPAIGFGWTF